MTLTYRHKNYYSGMCICHVQCHVPLYVILHLHVCIVMYISLFCARRSIVDDEYAILASTIHVGYCLITYLKYSYSRKIKCHKKIRFENTVSIFSRACGL